MTGSPTATIHPTLARLFADWNGGGIAWCLLRGGADLAAPRGDLDLLVAPADLPAARGAAERAGFVQMPIGRYGTHFLQYDRAASCWLWLHLVTDLAYGPYRGVATGAVAECLSRRETDGLVARLAPNDEFWAVLLHALLDRGVLTRGHRDRLRALTPNAGGNGRLAEAFQSVAPAGWTVERVVRTIQNGPDEDLSALAPVMIAACRRRAGIGLVGRMTRRLGRLRHGLRHVPRRRGVSVALLGPDGAGKSTLATGLEESFVFPSRRVYMGLTGGLLRYVDKLRIPGIVRVGRLLVLWGRYLRARYHQARGRLVIFDRYIYDADVPPPYRLTRAGRMARWIDGRSCPPPDLVIVLDVSGAEMHRRKGEYTPEMLEDWRQRFLKLGGRVPGVEIIDASQSAAAVRADVLERIWQRYAARWKAL
jgi:thymidylate kinase